MSSQDTSVVLVRHGETEYNRSGRYMGRMEKGLNALGREQAACAARRLAREGGAQVLITSPLQRTRETAGYLEEALGLTAEPDDGFLEVDLGPWEDRERSQVAAEDPERWKLWITDPAQVHVPGMEGVDALRIRIGKALDGVMSCHAGKSIVVVTHFACVITALLHALDLPNSTYRRFPVDNTSFTELRKGRMIRLERFNDTAHFSELSP
jgi:broad specificity phosphatase PhoE